MKYNTGTKRCRARVGQTWRISLPKTAYEISRISEIPKQSNVILGFGANLTGISGFPKMVARDFWIFRGFKNIHIDSITPSIP